jgi:hypothetical protein
VEHGDQEDMVANFEALARLTDLRFEKLWFIFENMCHTRQFTDGVITETAHGQSD